MLIKQNKPTRAGLTHHETNMEFILTNERKIPSKLLLQHSELFRAHSLLKSDREEKLAG